MRVCPKDPLPPHLFVHVHPNTVRADHPNPLGGTSYSPSGWLYVESNSVWPCVLMYSFSNLISLKLFTEAWVVKVEPTLMQDTLMAIGPMLLVWFLLFCKGKFREGKFRGRTDFIEVPSGS